MDRTRGHIGSVTANAMRILRDTRFVQIWRGSIVKTGKPKWLVIQDPGYACVDRRQLRTAFRIGGCSRIYEQSNTIQNIVNDFLGYF